jgi:hypothetical protein
MKTVIDIAREVWSAGGVYIGPSEKSLAQFAELVRADEREACALLARKTVCDVHIPTGTKIYGTAAAKAIRARSET